MYWKKSINLDILKLLFYTQFLDKQKEKAMPKISVLMPVYKTKPEYLKEAIESVLDQTFTDFELLILDDCPEDDRAEVVKSFKDERIKYLKNEKNLGITPSRNKLIELAKGEYLAVIDHDDVALPERFAEQKKVLDSHPEIGVVGCWVERFPAKKIAKYPEHNKEIEYYLMQGCAISHTGAMIRKSILGRNCYDEEFSPSEDYALWCQLLGKTQFYNIPKILMKYRWYEGNTSKKQADKMSEATKKIHNLVRKKHSDTWQDVCVSVPHLVRMKLFGLIPCGKFVQNGNRRKGILKYLPFITTKMKLEVK